MRKFVQRLLKRYFSDPQVIILILLLAAGLVLILLLGDMLLPVFVAIIIAYLLDGVVCRLERYGLSRNASVLIVFTLFIALVVVLLVGLLPQITRQIAQLVQELPAMLAKGQRELLKLPERYPDFISRESISSLFSLMGTNIGELGQRVLTFSLSSVRSLIILLVYLVLVPFLVFFFLKDKHLIFQWARDLLPEQRGLATRVWTEVNQQFANYVRGKIWEIVIIWAICYVVFSFMGLRFAMILSFFVGLSDLIPYVGSTIMAFPVALIAFLQWGLDWNFVYILIAYGIIQTFDGNILAPLLFSEVVNLHPVAIIVALLLFGGLWGVWGLIFAVPLATLVHAVYKAWTGSLDRPIPVTTARDDTEASCS
ncbi:MAG: AI-2E family transporter [Desulfomonilia bacterium]|jgi:putative permease